MPLYVLSGERFAGILLTAGVLNVLSIALLLRRMGRDGGSPALLASALVITLFLSWRGPSWLFSAWNPNVAVLPFGLALVSFASVAAGNARALPTAVVAGSFAGQTHLGCLPTVAVIATTAALLLAPRVRSIAGLPPRPPFPRRPLVIAAVLFAIVWAPPVIEQLSPAGGNLAHIVGFSSLVDERHAPGEVLSAAGTAIVGWLLGARGGPAAGLLLLLVAALAVAHGAARRMRSAFPAALSLVAVAGVAAAILSASRVAGPLLPYLFRWMAMLSVAAAALAAGLAPLWRARSADSRRPRLAATAAMVALAVMSGRNLALAHAVLRSPVRTPEEAASAARLAAVVAPAIASASRRPLVEVGPHTDRELVLGVLLALDKAGTRFAVRPFGPFRLGGRWAPDGTEDARLVLGAEDTALSATPGVRLLGREAGLFAYLVR